MKDRAWAFYCLLAMTWAAEMGPHGLVAGEVPTPGPHRVLMIHSIGREFAPFTAISSGFRTELARRAATPIEFREIALENARSQEDLTDGPVIRYLQAQFAEQTVHLVVTFGDPAARFWLRHRQELFPSTPSIVSAVDQRRIKGQELGTKTTAVTFSLDLPGAVEHVLQLLPGTTNIAVVLGETPVERYWAAEAQAAFQPFTGRVGFSWLNRLPLEEVRRRVSALPPHSAVLYGGIALDSAGVPYEQDRSLEVLHSGASAPIFGFLDHLLGRGVVGGPLLPTQDISRATAEVALRLLRGEPPDQVRTPSFGPAAPVYDWRELKRWNISEQRLPPGSTVRFRVPSQWEEHRAVIAAGFGLCALEAGLIVGLLVQKRRRQRAEAETAQHRAALDHLARVNTVGEMSGSLAHELNQPLGIILSNAQAAQHLLNQDPPDVTEVQSILADIVAADRRAGDVIRGLRGLLKPNHLSFQPLSLNEIVDEVLGLTRSELVGRGVEVQRDLAPELPPVTGGRVELEQLLLNLIMNSADAMVGNAPETRQLQVCTALRPRAVRLSVSDRGVGLPGDIESLFRPFFTTKPHGLGLGLAICRTITRVHRGKLWAEPHPAGGAVFHLELPVSDPAQSA